MNSVPSITNSNKVFSGFELPKSFEEIEKIIKTKLAEITLRAWTDEGFKRTLRNDNQAVIQEHTIPLGEGVEALILIDTPNEKNFVVPISPLCDDNFAEDKDLKDLATKYAGSLSGQPGFFLYSSLFLTALDFSSKIGDIIFRAWKDSSFKDTLKYDPNRVLGEYGIDFDPKIKVMFLIDTAKKKHFVVPMNPFTLSSDTDHELKDLADRHVYEVCSRTWGGGCRVDE